MFYNVLGNILAGAHALMKYGKMKAENPILKTIPI
jgi:hypothetical protein